MKIAIVGSRKMSFYGKTVIDQLLTKNFELGNDNLEITTLKVTGCNNEVVRMCQKLKLKIKVFEGKNFQKLNEQVANYADVLIVIEGGKKSGTLLLAQRFIEKGKEVWAVPGKITDENSWTSNWLIAQGARPLIEMEMLQ